jgi:hypothetical protein
VTTDDTLSWLMEAMKLGGYLKAGEGVRYKTLRIMALAVKQSDGCLEALAERVSYPVVWRDDGGWHAKAQPRGGGPPSEVGPRPTAAQAVEELLKVF